MPQYSGDVTVPAYVDLPASLCEGSPGLGIDAGASLIKVAYTAKDSGVRQGEPPVSYH